MFHGEFFNQDSSPKIYIDCNCNLTCDTTITSMPTGDWSDLPLLPSIADRLGLIDLLRFRAICKDWKAASSTASAKIEALPDHEPWFLVYGDNDSECTMVTECSTTKLHIIDIPQLNGTTCLGSDHGWLLLFREGSMFFLCPLSRAQIGIPCTFPQTLISNHIAIFSAPPTSKDCVVGVISQHETKLELHTIRRGATCWTKHTFESPVSKEIESTAYRDGVFFFFDNKDQVVYFPIEESEFYVMRAVQTYPKDKGLKESSRIHIFAKNVRHQINGFDKTQGVWFQPRFHQISDKQSW